MPGVSPAARRGPGAGTGGTGLARTGLVSLSQLRLVAGAAGDSAREVRVAVAAGVAAIGGDAAGPVLDGLAADDDPLVRAAALAAAGAIGCPPPLDVRALAALSDSAWQVRAGAAQALHAAGPAVAAGPLAAAAADRHADVRKAAVIALAQWTGSPAAMAALEAAQADSDADVRAYARRALT